MVPKKRKQKKSRIVENVGYTIQFQDWKPPYSIILDPKERFSPGPYFEINTIEINGIFLEPENLNDKPVDLYLQADRTLSSLIEGVEKLERPPKGVAAIVVRGQLAKFFCSLPMDFFQTLPFLLYAGKFKFFTCTGPKLCRGESPITSFSFKQEYNPEEE